MNHLLKSEALLDFIWVETKDGSELQCNNDGKKKKKEEVTVVMWTMWMYRSGGIDYGNCTIFQLKCK